VTLSTVTLQPTRRADLAAQPAWLRLSWVAVAASTLVACSSTKEASDADAEYRRAAALSRPLDVPPDLSQLPRDSRYQSASGIVSASSFQAGGPAVVAGGLAPGSVAPNSARGMKIERDGQQRWLSTPLTPEQLWPQLQAFWKDQGLGLETENADLGLMETEWAENRAKLPQDLIRSFLGSLADRLYSTGERDKYRMRLERSASGTDIFISHKGLAEAYSGPSKDGTVWERRPSEPGLEAEMLQRLLIKLGGKTESAVVAKAPTENPAAVAATTGPARARLVSSEAGPSLQMDDGFDRAWRRIGLALDRRGFTVEDRDRSQGLYFVRYVDPALAGKEEPGFFASLFGRKDAVIGVSRYRLLIKSSGNSSTVRVQNSQGQPETGEAADHILKLLLDEVK
jgi:outer membrane protein assembly factor BamC